MSILRKSSAVSSSSGVSNSTHQADVLIETLSKAFNKSVRKAKATTPTHSRQNSSRKNQLKSPHKRNPSISGSISLIPSTQKDSSIQTEHLSRPTHTHSYTRPTGPEIVVPHLPSCSSLPQGWSAVHDRFIAYLATHAPLTHDGKIPLREELEERWKTVDIVRLLGERFPRLAGANIRHITIENRLLLLDQAGDNDYFKIPYGGYMSEWASGI